MERKADRRELTFELRAVISRTTSFNNQKLYVVLTLRLSVLYGLLACKTLTDWSCITEVESFTVSKCISIHYIYYRVTLKEINTFNVM
jgi:hypothetical protein